ncbi:MAG TPA: cytochrome P450 [Acidimicrobiales bacterium]|nr:cytochrome P450 [Acidimicrobiales bacterium]
MYGRLREEAPVHWAEATGTFVLSRHADVHWALGETEALSSDAMRGVLLNQPMGTGKERLPREEHMGTIVAVDPPDHTALRRIVNRGFTPRRMQSWYEHIDGIATACLGAATAGEPFDVVAGLAAPLPVRVITAMVGADPAEADNFREWADALTRVQSGSARETGLSLEEAMAMMALADDLGRRIDERHERPLDDLLTDLVRAADDEVLSRAEAVGFAALLLFAGTETTTNLVGNAVAALIRHPEELARCQADPARIDRVIEETLRWESPVQYVFRRTTEPIERHGVEIPVDSIVTLVLGAANHDPRRWGSDAATFDPDRDTLGQVAFGFGPHFCLGAALARAETASALRHLVPSLTGRPVDDGDEWIDSMQFRGRRRFLVDVRARASSVRP